MPLNNETISHEDLAKLLESCDPATRDSFLENNKGIDTRMLHTVLENEFGYSYNDRISTIDVHPISSAISKDDVAIYLTVRKSTDLSDPDADWFAVDLELNVDNIQFLLTSLKAVESYLPHGILPTSNTK